MKKLIIVALVVANLGLLGGLMHTAGTREAQAANSYLETNYTMVAGRLESGNEILFVLDVASQQMAAFKYDMTSKRLDGVGIRNLTTDFRGRGN